MIIDHSISKRFIQIQYRMIIQTQAHSACIFMSQITHSPITKLHFPVEKFIYTQHLDTSSINLLQIHSVSNHF